MVFLNFLLRVKEFVNSDCRFGFLVKNCIYFTPGTPQNRGGANFNNRGGLLTRPRDYHFLAGSKVATASGDRTAKLWDAATGLVLATLEGQIESVNNSTFFAGLQQGCHSKRRQDCKAWECSHWASPSHPARPHRFGQDGELQRQ